MSKVKINKYLTEIENIFSELQRQGGSTKNNFLATKLPFTDIHSIGISEEGYPVFFIKSSLIGDHPTINLSLISVQYSQRCKIRIDGISHENCYTIIRLKSIDQDFIRYFIEIVSLILIKIGDIPKPQDLISELKTLVDLFRLFSNKPSKSIQGLWAELFVINESSNPSYLVKSWHISINDIYDFNDGFNKLEVKSTIKKQRIHRFANEQLNPNKGSFLAICSVMMTITGQGISILDLKNLIEQKLNIEDRLRLNEIIVGTLGSDFEKAIEVYFDYQKALDSFKVFNYKDIPSVDMQNIPSEISNLHYDCDLTTVPEAKDSFLKSIELFKGLRNG